MEQSETNQTTGAKPKKNIAPKIIIPIIILIALGIIVPKVWHAFKYEETDNAQIEMRLTPILSRVAGYVDKIYVEDFGNVKKGQLMMTIDTTELSLQLDEMEADYNQAFADIDNAKASLNNAQASISLSKGNTDVIALRRDKALNDLNRDKGLYESKVITKKQLDDSQSNYDITLKQLETSIKDTKVAESKLNVLQSQLEKANAQVKLKKTRIDQQKLKISYCSIYATSDGNIGKRNVDAGQFVQAGMPVFTIVNNQDLWIVANFKESQIKNLQTGKEVEIKVDGYPNLEVKGKITTISEATGARFSLLPPDNATGNFIKVTQRIPVKIEIENMDKYKNILRAGMSVDVATKIN